MKLPKPIIPVICTVLLLCSSAMQAPLPAPAEGLEQSRLVTRATMYGVGFTNVFDTYLSPLEYTGIDFRVSRESMRMTRWMDGRLSLQSFFQADLGYTRNKADNNNTFSALANWNYGLHYNFPITGNFKLLAGGLADLNGGFVYNLRNTNNPASARAYINLDVSGMAIWNLRIKNYPLTLRQMLTADFPVGRAKMRFAYIWDAQQSHVNDIKTHTYSHVFMVGFVKELYLLKNKRKK